MKCYSCGKTTESHAVGCPDKDKPKEYLIPTHFPKPPVVVHLDPKPDIDVTSHKELYEWEKGHSPANTIIGFSFQICDAGRELWLTTQPCITVQVNRLWVADECCDYFTILDVRITNVSCILEPVYASHFAMKYRDKYPLATDFKRSCNPAQRVSIGVRNHDVFEARTFRALLECTIIKQVQHGFNMDGTTHVE